MTTTVNPHAETTVRVGDLATLIFPEDQYPYAVTTVSPQGHKITLLAIATDDVKAARHDGPFPILDARWAPGDEYTTTPGSEVTAYRDAHGRYRISGQLPLLIGTARFYRNYKY